MRIYILRQELSQRLEPLLKVVIWTAALVALLTGAFLKVDEKEYQQWPTIQSLVSLNRSSAWWLLPSCIILGGFLELIRKRIGEPNAWKLVQYLLDQLREEIFKNVPNAKQEPPYYHRVTLYRFRKTRYFFIWWPGTGWLVPVARSGTLTKNWIPCFRVSASNPDRCVGVAGRTWSSEKPELIYDLPDINMPDPPQALLEEYASKSLVSVKWLKKRKGKPLPLSMLGIPVEVKGDPWGVLVVDSRTASAIASEAALGNKHMRQLTGVLSRAVEML